MITENSLQKTKNGDHTWQKIKEGNEKAFGALYTQLFFSLIRYVRHIVKDNFLAEDIVQDVFLKLLNKKQSIDVRESVYTYIFKVAHHESINKLQHLATAKNKVNKTVSKKEWQYIEDTYNACDPVIEYMEKDEDIDIMIHQAIDSLSEKCRKIFILNYYGLLSNEEISKKMNISENTVRVHIFNALKVIRQKIMIERYH